MAAEKPGDPILPSRAETRTNLNGRPTSAEALIWPTICKHVRESVCNSHAGLCNTNAVAAGRAASDEATANYCAAIAAARALPKKVMLSLNPLHPYEWCIDLSRDAFRTAVHQQQLCRWKERQKVTGGGPAHWRDHP